jgi:hypothetical protein
LAYAYDRHRFGVAQSLASEAAGRWPVAVAVCVRPTPHWIPELNARLSGRPNRICGGNAGTRRSFSRYETLARPKF